MSLSFVVAGASRGLGVSVVVSAHSAFVLTYPQLEFVKQLLANGNVVIALARNPSGAKGLFAIESQSLHILQADITDAISLKVKRVFSPVS